MRVDVTTDLVPENVDALVTFSRLFETPRFKRLATLGLAVGADTDVRTLRRVMADVLQGASRSGLVVSEPAAPVIEVPEEVLSLLEQIVQEAQAQASAAGLGDWERVIEALEQVLAVLQARPEGTVGVGRLRQVKG